MSYNKILLLGNVGKDPEARDLNGGKVVSFTLATTERAYTKQNGTPRATAEILYRYITQDVDFIEDHTGLEDVLIEKEIFVRCMKQHKKMRKGAFEK